MKDPLMWPLGGVVAVLGVLGLFLAAGARDGALYIFGLGLLGFACLYIFDLMRRSFDAAKKTAAGQPADKIEGTMQ
jgi:hypothetical protein